MADFIFLAVSGLHSAKQNRSSFTQKEDRFEFKDNFIVLLLQSLAISPALEKI